MTIDSQAERFFQEICFVLAHPLRREILDFLFEESRSFAEISSACKVDNGQLGYHLRSMKDLVRHDSKVYSLTEKGRLVCEWLNETYLDLESLLLDLEVSAENNPIRYAPRLKQSDHAILLYEDEARKRAVVLSFLKAGLSKGNAALYLISEKRRDHEVKWLRRTFEIREAEQRQALTIMSSEEWYLQRGKASADTIISNAMKLGNEKMVEGYPGLQSVTEMKPLVENVKWSELVDYETRLQRKLPPMYCGMCVYEAHKLLPDQFISIIKAHGQGIFHSLAFPLS